MQTKRPSPQLVEARKKEIARRYRKGGKRKRSPRQIATLRVHDLGKLFRARYGQTLPDDDAGRDDMMLALQHLAGLPQAAARCRAWVDTWAPWMTLGESNELMASAIMNARAWTADQLAWRLGLTMADRTALGITTIGAVDCSKAQRTKLRKAKDRERKRRRRAAIKAASAP